MSLIAKTEVQHGFEPLAEGVHVARCYGLVDLGMQYSEKFDKSAHKCLIMWELPDETFEVDGETKYRTLSKEFTMSLHEKSSLTKSLEAWRGKKFTEEELAGFDLRAILGKGCQIQILHAKSGDKTYANIASIMGMPKGMKLAAPAQTIIFDLDSKTALADMAKLPEWIQDKIRVSETYQDLVNGNQPDEEEEVQLPF